MWVGLSDTNTFSEENPLPGKTWDAVPPYKTNTIWTKADYYNGITGISETEENSSNKFEVWPRDCFMVAPYDGYVEKIIIKSTTGTNFLLEKIHFLNNILDSGEDEGESNNNDWRTNPNTSDGFKTLYTYLHRVNITGSSNVSRGSEAYDPNYWSDAEEYIARLNNQKLASGFWNDYAEPFPALNERGDTIIITSDMLKYKMTFSAGDSISLIPVVIMKDEDRTYRSGGANTFEFYKYGMHVTICFRYFTRLDAYSKPISDNFPLTTEANQKSADLADSAGIPDFGPKKTLFTGIIPNLID